ncbi:MAG: acyltransferase domain-containing protein [Clostridia bacterium]
MSILNRLSFTPDQRDALHTLRNITIAQPTAASLLMEDLQALIHSADPLLITSQQAQQTAFASLWELYPALVLLQAIPALEKQYEDCHISLDIMWDALADIPLWVENFQRHTGRPGLAEYGWLTNHLRFRLFRLGRLEYIYNTSRVPAYGYRHRRTGNLCFLAQEKLRYTAAGAIAQEQDECWISRYQRTAMGAAGHLISSKGSVSQETTHLSTEDWALFLSPKDPILDVHIPEGPPLLLETVMQSLESALPFFANKLGITGVAAFTCGSWLMSPSLPILAPGSHIAAFQQMFHVVPYTVRDNQIFERVYGRPFSIWEDMPMQTHLQRAVRDWYLLGNNCRQMQGVYLLPERERECL